MHPVRFRTRPSASPAQAASGEILNSSEYLRFAGCLLLSLPSLSRSWGGLRSQCRPGIVFIIEEISASLGICAPVVIESTYEPLEETSILHGARRLAKQMRSDFSMNSDVEELYGPFLIFQCCMQHRSKCRVRCGRMHRCTISSVSRLCCADWLQAATETNNLEDAADAHELDYTGIDRDETKYFYDREYGRYSKTWSFEMN